jgi:hypothetical protein
MQPAGEDLNIDIKLPVNRAIQVTLKDESGEVLDIRIPRLSQGHAEAHFDPLPPGAYAIDTVGTSIASPLAPIRSDLIVWDPEVG